MRELPIGVGLAGVAIAAYAAWGMDYRGALDGPPMLATGLFGVAVVVLAAVLAVRLPR